MYVVYVTPRSAGPAYISFCLPYASADKQMENVHTAKRAGLEHVGRAGMPGKGQRTRNIDKPKQARSVQKVQSSQPTWDFLVLGLCQHTYSLSS